MKKIYLIALVILSSTTIFSQEESEYDKLDKRNGFKIFKFGQSIQEYERVLSKNFETPLNLYRECSKKYRYHGEEPSELYNWEWKELNLTFCKGKLIEIELIWDPTDHALPNNHVYNDIVKKLSIVFGNPEVFQMTTTEVSSWAGKKIDMKMFNGITIFNKDKESVAPISLSILNRELANGLLFDYDSEF